VNVRYPSPALPFSRSLTDLLLDQHAPQPRRIDPTLRKVLGQRLARRAPDRANGSISLDSFTLTRILRNDTTSSTPFAWSPRAARRILGLAATQRLVGGAGGTPTSAVRAEIEDVIQRANEHRSRSGSLGQWLAEAPPGVLAVVIAEAVTYATELLISLEWERVLDTASLGTADALWAVPGAPWVSLKGRRDLVVDSADDAPRTLLAVRGGRPGTSSTIDLAHVALVDGLTHPDRPHAQRVVGYWPAAGRALGLDVDGETLKFAARNVVTALEQFSQPSRSLRAA
jgi:hypothetical protein